MRRKAIIAIGIIGVGICLAPFLFDEERVALSQEHRRGNAGEDVQLSQGSVRYQRVNAGANPPVILIHGVSGPMAVWDKTFAALEKEGIHAVRYDLYGRGLSDRPDVRYDEVLYRTQLEELLAALRVDGPVDLVGSSMGCIVATGFAAAHPDRVRRVALIGPAGFPLEATPLAKLMAVPGLAEYLMSVFGGRTLTRHNRKYFAQPRHFEEFAPAFRPQLTFKGYKRAILSTTRSMPLQDFAEGYGRFGRSQKPTLILWGRADQTFPFEHHVQLKALIPHAELVALGGVAHLPQWERPDEVNARLLQFLSTPVR